MKIKDIFLCWDFIGAVFICGILYMVMPQYIKVSLLKSVFSTIVSVSSIIFSLFFAGMSIILNSNDDDFIRFLEEDNIYSNIIATFKFTLVVNFISLTIHVFMYFLTGLVISEMYEYLNKKWICFLNLIFFYSIFSVFNSVIDAIKYYEKRLKYIKFKN